VVGFARAANGRAASAMCGADGEKSIRLKKKEKQKRKKYVPM